MSLSVRPNPTGFGAAVSGIDLSRPLAPRAVAELRALWLQHQVLWFPDQPLNHDQLATFSLSFGPFGHDPYVKPVDGHPHILEVRREPREKTTPFGASWHSDWSFQQTPPSATILHAKVVPAQGGDTLFADAYAAWDALTALEQAELETLTAIHSARRPYSREGFLAGGGAQRSMTILPSDSALAVQEHPLVRTHPETGRRALWINAVYTIGIRELSDVDAQALIRRLCAHATEDRFVYRHRWQQDMLTMWDNRCVQHCAQGGYDGELRVMHRTTVAGDAPR
ncbi:MAG: TauD/TfdA family dioxygenase [Pseudomonadales bacterium]|nr:TauD/TfdA family dioxygenase [Pseudomonadales bacterium]